MKKTVEVEYVGIEDVQDIIDDAYALTLAGNFVSVTMSNYNGEKTIVSIIIMLGGWERDKAHDYSFTFAITDDKRDVDEMNKCKNALLYLLDMANFEAEEDARRCAEEESYRLEGKGYEAI